MRLTTILTISAFLAFAFCLLGGLWILAQVDFSKSDDMLVKAIGFYFVGKAFFVGPMLLAAGRQGCNSEKGTL